MLSHRFWRQGLGANPAVIGARVDLNGTAFTIIGVTPASFEVPSGIEIGVPKTNRIPE